MEHLNFGDEMNNAAVPFSERDQLMATAIVKIFETGLPMGEYDALAVLDDGAGISYGISQFTHRSGSLHAVAARYLAKGGGTGRAVLIEKMALLRSASAGAIRAGSNDGRLKAALKDAARTSEMRLAQREIDFEKYLRPAVEACSGSGFVLPLSLAVIYDSMTHGSWEMMRDRITTPRPPAPAIGFEKAWITAYVKKRHEWLRGIPRLRSTSYRTAFFLTQIIAGNWQLETPISVHGFRLSQDHFPPVSTGLTNSAAGPLSTSADSSKPPQATSEERSHAFPVNARTPKLESSLLEYLEKNAGSASAMYDRFEAVIRSVLTRSDAAKSLWTTVAGTAWQSFWAVSSFLIGLPLEIWLIVAIIAGVLMFFYLYRQFALGIIRENQRAVFLTPSAGRHQSPADQSHE